MKYVYTSLKYVTDKGSIILSVRKWIFPFREKPEEAFHAAKLNQSHTVKSVTLKSAHLQKQELHFYL